MSHGAIEKQEIGTLKAFYHLMARTRDLRASVVKDIFDRRAIEPQAISSLGNALGSLEAIPTREGRFLLALDASREIEVELGYEIGELKKDILFLEQGEADLLGYLAQLHPGFDQQVGAGVALLGGKRFNCFITDRDGTINNYCGRYRSSIQSAYNAVFLTRFAESCCENPIIITSAPLRDPGIVDVSVNPEKKFVYAASKGREFIDLQGERRGFPVAPGKQALLDRLNRQLKDLVEQPEYQKYALIGSGLQLKFGQTTIARQDISNSIAADESLAFMDRLTAMVKELDPDSRNFRIEDTGLDVEVILTIESDRDGLKDFDKADSVNYLARELGLDLARGPHLVCGDTRSDTPMIDAVMAHSKDTYAIFVTTRDQLRERVHNACGINALTVSTPDALAAILNALAK
ncbi:MAG: trehalose 6-phosphate synthase [bacterium]